MDMETIKRINREALRTAQEAEGMASAAIDSALGGENQMMMYLLAAAVAAGCYFLLQQMKPKFVMTGDNETFDQPRAIVLSVVAGILVLVVHHFMTKQ